jgi:glycosyltransferase involved in cell wall biosynthesis
LFDELGIPVVSYVEFPSYRLHGWDPAYPPTEGQRLTDANLEMLTYHQILRSRLTIVPTQYAKSLIPQELQHKVHVQFEGFRIEPPPEFSAMAAPQRVVGFAASGLCSAKGYQNFVRIADALARRGSEIRCVAMGDPARSPYSYEQQVVDRHFQGKGKTFHDYLVEQYPASRVELLGRLPYAQFAQRVAEIDVFLYPLQHGVGNWGLIELLSRGRAVIGSTRCFLPECIEDGVNGYLVDSDDPAAWLARIDSVFSDALALRSLQRRAYESARKFAIEAVAPRYMQLGASKNLRPPPPLVKLHRPEPSRSPRR